MKEFKTESKKLLDLMINSIYTNREIFLRELISNASDAVDKLVFKSLTDANVQVDRSELGVQVSFDKDARTISVRDNGIGMTAEELDANLGTIAHSGSEAFKTDNAEAQGTDVDIIGQFGVGFYSSFMVASKVRVVSRAFGSDEVNAWECDGLDGYTIEPATPEEAALVGDHGTCITLYLRESTEDENTDELLSEWRLKELIRKYSNYVRYPVRMEVTKRRQLPKPEDAPEDYKPEWESYTELETINSIKPIWKKAKSEVSQEDYDEFYKATFHDYAAPARTISFHAEGRISYDGLLFIPSKAPFDLYSADYEKGIALYSSNVLIQEKCADLVPDYFNFVRGVVDSPDISLNISRETLQQNSQLKAIAKHVERQVKTELGKMLAEDREGYEKFFENFGRGLKFGIYASYGMKAAELGDLMLFWSARENKMVTFREYVDGMAEGQDKIYYAAGDSRERLEKLPMVKAALARGFDVLLCTQDVDEFMLQAMHAYHVPGLLATDETEGKEARDIELANVASADLNLATDEEKQAAEKASGDNEALLSAMKEALGDKVSSVKVSAGLGDSPAVLTSEGQVSLEMERIMSMMPESAMAPKAQRVLELNAQHPVFAKLCAAQQAGEGEKVALYAKLLLDQALLVSGMPVDDPVAFAENVCALM